MTQDQQQQAIGLIRARLAEIGMSQGQLAREIGSRATRISDIIHERRSLTWSVAIQCAEVLWPDADVLGDVWLSLFGVDMPDELR